MHSGRLGGGGSRHAVAGCGLLHLDVHVEASSINRTRSTSSSCRELPLQDTDAASLSLLSVADWMLVEHWQQSVRQGPRRTMGPLRVHWERFAPVVEQVAVASLLLTAQGPGSSISGAQNMRLAPRRTHHVRRAGGGV